MKIIFELNLAENYFTCGDVTKCPLLFLTISNYIKKQKYNFPKISSLEHQSTLQNSKKGEPESQIECSHSEPTIVRLAGIVLRTIFILTKIEGRK